MHLENNQQFENSPVSVTEWILSLFISSIPLIGTIMLFVWAFGGNTQISKANWAKAMLVLYLIGIVLVAVFWTTIFGVFMASGQDLN